MLTSLLEQAAMLLVAAALLGVPGWALVTLLRVRAVLPDTLAVPAAAVFGIAVASIATAVQLTAQIRSAWAIGVHVALSVALVAWALVLERHRRANDDRIVPAARGWSWWTSGIVVVTGLFAWYIRGAIKLDGLYHTSVSRKLIELAHPTFGNINRFADGGPNPTYALPAWHALVGWVAQLTGLDVIQSWEIMPVLIVVLGTLAAAGLTRILLGNVARGEVLGAGVWAIMRVFFARREVDGDAILFGAVPGQITFEIIFPTIFALIAVAMWTGDRRVKRSALITMTVCIAMLVVLHANYVPYVGIVGIGYVVWWLAVGPFRSDQWRRTLAVAGAAAAACLVFMGVLLPLLASLENFGNPSEESRIDYHLTKTLGMQHIRGGHLYEMLGLPGLLAIVVMPWVAARWRSREMSLANGGLLAIGGACIIPPFFAVLRATGSLTVGLRINHIFGELLIPVLAAAILLVASWAEQHLESRGRGRVAASFLALIGLVALVGAGVVIGYARFYPNIPGYLAWGALAIVWIWRLVQRLRGNVFLRSEPAPTLMATDNPPDRARGFDVPRPNRAIDVGNRALAATVIVLVIGLGFPVGAISLKRAKANVQPISAGIRTGDLKCLGGPVADALVKVTPGTLVLSDPATSFKAMSLAPVYVVGDYKVWNSPTKDNRTVERLAQVNQFFDTSLSDQDRLKILADRKVRYILVDLKDGRWLRTDPPMSDTATIIVDRVNRSLDKFADFQAYDGRAIADLINAHPDVFARVAVDRRSTTSALPIIPGQFQPPCNSFGLWKVDFKAADNNPPRVSYTKITVG
jgi:hypothetical protein